MKSSVLNTGKGILSKCLKMFCLVVAVVAGLCGDVWGRDYTMQNVNNARWNQRNSWNPNGVPVANIKYE